MGSLVLGLVGAAIGSTFGMPQIGYAVGSMLGSALESSGSGATSRTTVEGPKLSDSRVMNSAYGIDIPRIFNSGRLAGNVIWSSKIKETQHTSTETISSSGGGGGGGGKGFGGGGGGGGGSSTQEVTTISYTYAQDLAIAICKGPITGIKRIWANSKIIFENGVGACTFTLHLGDETQVADSYMQSINGADKTPAYRGTAYIVFADLQLASFGNATPSLEFEVETAVQDLGGIVSTLLLDSGLTSNQFDVTALTDSVMGYRLVNRGTTRQFIEPLATTFFFDAVESNAKLKFVKRGNPVVAATILQDDLDAREPGSAPGDLLRTSRKMELELTQELVVVYSDKDKYYDQSQQYDRKLSTASRVRRKVEVNVVLQASDALKVAVTQLHSEWVARMSYTLKVGRKYTALEPTDIIDVVKNGIHFPMRIRTKNEAKPGIIEFETNAEDSGVWTYSAPTSLNVPSLQPFYGNAPGNIRTPMIFDAPETSSPTGCELLVAACGQTVEWGGCRVWVSLDNATFSPVGVIRGASCMGVTTNALPLVADPDLSSTLGVDLNNSRGTLTSVPQVASDARVSLCYLDGEMITYKNSTLVSLGRYDLSVLHRGVYTTPPGAHGSGVPFVFVDPRVFRYPYLPDLVGRTIYLRFTSFNTYLLAEEEHTAVPSYSYQLKGPLVQTINSLVLASPWVGKDVKVKWGDVTGAETFTVVVKSGGTVLRTVPGITSHEFTYTFEDNTADNAGSPKRALSITLTAVGLGLGQATATIDVSNSQLAVPSGISIYAGVAAFVATFILPSEPDFAGFMVKYSTTSGFDPSSAGTQAYDGPGAVVAVMSLLPSTTYYVRLRAYDIFEKTTSVWSSEFAVTTMSSGGIVTRTTMPANPTEAGALAFFLDVPDQNQRGLWGWDGTAWVNTKDGANLVANSVTVDKLAVSQLSGISADLGTITAGNITLDNNGWIRSFGMPGWGASNGIFLGYIGGSYKLQVGNAAGEYIMWNGTQIFINSPQFAIGNGLAIFAGSLQVKSAASGARMEIYNNVQKIYDANGVLRVKIGDLAA